MTTGKIREFNRLYNNLQELCNRIFDDENNYPQQACADWFIDSLQELLKDGEYVSLLELDKINFILEMSYNIRKRKDVTTQNKQNLTILMRELKVIRVNFADENNVKQDSMQF